MLAPDARPIGEVLGRRAHLRPLPRVAARAIQLDHARRCHEPVGAHSGIAVKATQAHTRGFILTEGERPARVTVS